MTPDPNGSGTPEEQDELARRRAAGEDPTSIEDRAADGEADEEQEPLFVMEYGRKVGLGSLYRRGTPVIYEFNLSGKSVKGASDMGLVSFDNPDMVLIVPTRAGKVEIEPTYSPEGTVKHVTVRAHQKPKMVYDAATPVSRSVLPEVREPVEA